MKPYTVPLGTHRLLIIVLVFLAVLSVIAGFTASASRNRRRGNGGKAVRRIVDHGTISVPQTTGGPKIWLQDPQSLQVNHKGAKATEQQLSARAQPLSLAAADLDEDGIEDLVVGYGTTGGVVIAIHRGNLDAFAPQSRESFAAIGEGRFPSPFLREARVIEAPARPDFIATGIFSASDHRDIVLAARGSNSIYLISNDGKGNFSQPQAIDVGGSITALASGEFGVSGAYGKLLVTTTSGNGSFLKVFAGTESGLQDVHTVALSAAATNIEFGDFGDGGQDAAFIAGGKVYILRAAAMQLVEVSLPISVRAMALGSFMFDRNGGAQMALLGTEGSVHFAVRSEFDPRSYSVEECQAIRRAKLNNETPPYVPERSFPADGWRIVERTSAVGPSGGEQPPVLLRTRVSSNGADDVMLLSAVSRQLWLISHADVPAGSPTFAPGEISVRPYNGSPVAGLAMRVNIDGRPGIVALHRDEVSPSVLMPLPDPTFFPNRFDDPTPTSPITNACNNVSNSDMSSSCSLREAVLRANATAGTDTISLAAGTYTLTLAKVNGDYTGNHGALYINDSVNITGQVDGGGNP